MFQHVHSPDNCICVHLNVIDFFCKSLDANCANESIGLKNVSWHCSWMDQLYASELRS
jgi:hypothetical protein